MSCEKAKPQLLRVFTSLPTVQHRFAVALHLRQSTCQVPPWWQGLSPGWVFHHSCQWWKKKLAEITPKRSPVVCICFFMMRFSLPHLAWSVGLFCVCRCCTVFQTRGIFHIKNNQSKLHVGGTQTNEVAFVNRRFAHSQDSRRDSRSAHNEIHEVSSWEKNQ